MDQARYDGSPVNNINRRETSTATTNSTLHKGRANTPVAKVVSADFDDTNSIKRSLRLPGLLGLSDNASSQPHGWKPLSLTSTILGSLALLTLLIAAAVEILARRSEAYAGLAISPTLDAIPDYAMWSYLYGPNLVAVLYSLLWNWVDLDARRMQPWFELSKPEGAAAEDSLLLDYPFDFVAFAPWKAAKKRHWPVLLASTNMLLVLWALTPLQSALLATDVIKHVDSIQVNGRSQLIETSMQSDRMNAVLRGTVYHTTWLNLSFPEFTTPDYALAPFRVDAEMASKGGDRNITGATTKFSTELSCSPARVVVGDFEAFDDGKWNPVVPFYLLDGSGCNSTVFPDDIIFRDSDPEVSMRYWGSYTDDNFFELEPMDGPWRWELASPECPDAKNKFFAAWIRQKYNGEFEPPDFNITAIWCEASYYKEQVRAHISATTLRPSSTPPESLRPREPLTIDEFNSTAFEKFIKTGQLDQSPVRTQEIELFQPESFLVGTSLADLYTPIEMSVGYALAVDMLDIEEYANPEALAHAYTVAWKQQFSLVAHHLMVNSSDEPSAYVEMESTMAAIVVSRSFATALEALLLFVAIAAMALAWACHKAPCNLRANPSSISRIGNISGDSPEVAVALSPLGSLRDDKLKGKLRGQRFRLLPAPQIDGRGPVIQKIGDIDAVETEEVPDEDKFFEPIRPFALKKWSGIMFAVAMSGAIIGLGYLKAADKANNGLERPTDNFEILQLLENYIPTIFATLVEPFWVMLNRLLCMLQPFRDLGRGRASPRRSIEATYTAIPPQLAIWRALASRHLVLVMVCSTALMANLLALSMGALFNEEPVKVEIEGQLAAAFAPRFETALADVYRAQGRIVGGGPRKPHLVSTQANVMDRLELPAWTTSDYYFMPGTLVDLPMAKNYTLRTQGFTLTPECTGFGMEEIPLVPPTREKNSSQCYAPLEDVDRSMRNDLGSSSFSLDPAGDAKYTYLHRWPSQITDEEGATLDCDPHIFWGWGRTKDAADRNATAAATKVLCRPRFEVASFNVTVDGDGKVLSYNRTSKLSNTLADDKSTGHVRMMITLLQEGGLVGPVGWYNDTSYHDVLDMLLVQTTNSTAIIDPSQSPPAPEVLASAMDKIYRQLFVSMLSFNNAVFAKAGPEDMITGIAHVEEIRILMNGPAFIITMTILGLNVIVTLLFYAQTSTLVLPRLPTTIGSVIAYIAPSRFVIEGNEKDATYSFGRYVGYDGKTHVGIDKDPYVVPIEPGSLGEKRSLVRRLGWRRKGERDDKEPWL